MVNFCFICALLCLFFWIQDKQYSILCSFWSRSSSQTSYLNLVFKSSLSLSLSDSHLNTSSLLCDCQLKWFPQWVAEHAFLPLVNASCAHPQMLKAKSVFVVSQDQFVCGEFASTGRLTSSFTSGSLVTVQTNPGGPRLNVFFFLVCSFVCHPSGIRGLGWESGHAHSFPPSLLKLVCMVTVARLFCARRWKMCNGRCWKSSVFFY